MSRLAAALAWIGVAALADRRGQRHLFSWRRLDSEAWSEMARR